MNIDPESEQGTLDPEDKKLDRKQYTAKPWYERRWVRGLLLPMLLIAAAIYLMSGRSKESAAAGTGAYPPRQSPAEKPMTLGDLKGLLRDGSVPTRTAVAPGPDTQSATEIPQRPVSSAAPDDTPDPRAVNPADEQRRRRDDAFAAPIFAHGTSAPLASHASPEKPSPEASADPSLEQMMRASGYLAKQSPTEQPTEQPGADSIATQQAVTKHETERADSLDENHSSGPLHRILPGTIWEAVMDTALESSMTGVVLAHLSRDGHGHDLMGPVLAPAGTKLVGFASAVTQANQQRMKVSFDMAIMPDGYVLLLNNLAAADPAGRAGLVDHVDNHYRQVIGVSLAIGLIDGLGTGSMWNQATYSPRSEVMSGITAQTSQEGIHLLDHFLNRPPTVQVRPGSLLRIVFPMGIKDVPEYQNHRMRKNL